MSIRFREQAVALTGDIERACLDRTGRIRDVERLTGGNVSHVFRLNGERGTVVVKIRGTTFARIPALTTSPDLVRVEARALDLFSSRMPDTFPEVVALDAAQGVLVLADLGTGAVNLHHRWMHGRPTSAEIAALATETAGLLLALAPLPQAIRDQGGEGDERIRGHLLGYCLRTFGHPALARAADACESEPTQLVHGDLCPKNVLLTDGGLRLCDLDNAHRGSRSFEIGYLLAHIVLHLAGTHDIPGSLAVFRDACATAGLVVDPADPLVVTVMSGVLLYRLSSELVPYATHLSSEQRAEARSRLLRLLDAHPGSVHHLCRVMAAVDGGREGGRVPDAA